MNSDCPGPADILLVTLWSGNQPHGRRLEAGESPGPPDPAPAANERCIKAGGLGGGAAVELRVPNPGHGANPLRQALGGRGLCRWTSSQPFYHIHRKPG